MRLKYFGEDLKSSSDSNVAMTASTAVCTIIHNDRGNGY